MMAVVIPKAVTSLQANSVCFFSCSIFDHVFTAKTNQSNSGLPQASLAVFTLCFYLPLKENMKLFGMNAVIL